MCDCLEQITMAWGVSRGAVDVEIDLLVNFTAGKVYPRMSARYTLPGKKRKTTISLQPTCCPFCGVKYDEEAKSESKDDEAVPEDRPEGVR